MNNDKIVIPYDPKHYVAAYTYGNQPLVRCNIVGEEPLYYANFECYDAAAHKAKTVFGEFQASGTLCGNIDFVVPDKKGTEFKVFPLTTEEAMNIVKMLTSSIEDVLRNANPNDPRLY